MLFYFPINEDLTFPNVDKAINSHFFSIQLEDLNLKSSKLLRRPTKDRELKTAFKVTKFKRYNDFSTKSIPLSDNEICVGSLNRFDVFNMTFEIVKDNFKQVYTGWFVVTEKSTNNINLETYNTITQAWRGCKVLKFCDECGF